MLYSPKNMFPFVKQLDGEAKRLLLAELATAKDQAIYISVFE